MTASIVFILAQMFALEVSIVRGRSMQPVLADGDRLVIDRFGGENLRPGRFDVVVLQAPDEEGVDYVKRVIAFGGEIVSIREGQLFVDGKQVVEEHGPALDRSDFEPLAVPDGHCFVLGDNRSRSCDSREFGCVPLTSIRGTVRARVWPLERFAFF